ncbi:MAG: NAD-binding protein [Eubacterium sp.]|nr:NAD-binding protein [Eubacterium sp.]
MKLLVYGAGVIGCELAHVLKKGGNDVTLLARGERKDNLEKRGLRSGIPKDFSGRMLEVPVGTGILSMLFQISKPHTVRSSGF